MTTERVIGRGEEIAKGRTPQELELLARACIRLMPEVSDRQQIVLGAIFTETVEEGGPAPLKNWQSLTILGP